MREAIREPEFREREIKYLPKLGFCIGARNKTAPVTAAIRRMTIADV